MLKENEIKTLVAPIEFNNRNELKTPTYLIQKVDNCNYLIHRELTNVELKSYEENEIFEYKNKKFLFCIVNVQTEEEAEAVIKSYWKAFIQLNNMV